MLDAGSISGLSKASGAGYLSSIMNPKNVLSMSAIDLNNQSNVYITTLQDENTDDKKKKITIIKRKRRSDGSVESSKQNIYKDYGDSYAELDARRLNSALKNYRSTTRLELALQPENMV